jgi:hypothetical protein
VQGLHTERESGDRSTARRTRAAELAQLTRIAKGYGLRVHMDGARFANALVHLGATPAELTWEAGIDLLSFGATKNGAMMAEALPRASIPALGRRARTPSQARGHLLSKMRFVSAQLEAYLDGGLWFRLARHANAAAQAIAAGFEGVAGAELLQPVQGNEVFLRLSPAVAEGLQAAGFGFNRWPRTDDVYRFVAAFDTPSSAGRGSGAGGAPAGGLTRAGEAWRRPINRVSGTVLEKKEGPQCGPQFSSLRGIPRSRSNPRGMLGSICTARTLGRL